MEDRFSAASREGALIVACLRARYDAGARANVIDSIREADWPRVLALARRHGIVPLLYESLSGDLVQLPEKTRGQFQKQFQQTAVNSFLYATELVRLTELLQQRGIRALPFKGTILAALLYRKLSLRTVRDLDILVARDQFYLALSVLQEGGYTVAEDQPGHPEASPGKHVLLVDDRGFQVELHWAIADRDFGFSLGFAQLWAARKHLTVLDHSIVTVSPEDLFLMLGAHGTFHSWESLKWVCDFAQAATVLSDLDWSAVLERAQALGCKRMLLIGMALARNICGIPLPDSIEGGIRSDKVITGLCSELQASLFVPRRPVTYIERLSRFTRSRERLRDRMHFIQLELRPTERDRNLIRLPDSLQMLYVPIRLMRVALFKWRVAVTPLLRAAFDRGNAGGA